MDQTSQDSPIQQRPSRRLAAAAPVAILVVVGCAVWWNSLTGAFVFDDYPAIVENRTIRSLWPPGAVLSPPRRGSPVTGRPLVNLSLAANYALGGAEPRGYHAVNLAIHILAGLTLFGIVRRTLMLPRLGERLGGRSAGLALAAAMIWLVHPLQTESVTYLSQRAESLAGLLYLATMYCCLRAFQTDRGSRWGIAAVALCLAGMATKETVATLPVIVLLYDRTFLSHSFRQAIKRRWLLYSSLAATWVLLAVLVYQAGNRGGTAGFGQGVTPWEYAKTQLGAVVHYLRLCFWPSPLILDYGTDLATGTWQVVPYAVVIILLVIATLVSMRYLPWAGFLGACFFLILLPTSSFVPVATQTMAEHRMYLPSAAVVVMAVMLADWGWRRLVLSVSPLRHLPEVIRRTIPVAVIGALVAGEAYLTILRNNDYRSEISIWQDAIRKVPSNYRAYNALGLALASSGKVAQAVEQYRRAIDLKPDYALAYVNLGNALVSQGHVPEGIDQYQRALNLHPDYPEAHYNLGLALASQGRTAEAFQQYQEAAHFRPDYAEAHYNVGVLLASYGRLAEAIEEYRRALKSKPDYAEAHNNVGSALAQQGRLDEAVQHFELALKFKPDSALARANLNKALAARRAGRPPTASAPGDAVRP